jgi:hypothetical protein
VEKSATTTPLPAVMALLEPHHNVYGVGLGKTTRVPDASMEEHAAQSQLAHKEHLRREEVYWRREKSTWRRRELVSRRRAIVLRRRTIVLRRREFTIEYARGEEIGAFLDGPWS